MDYDLEQLRELYNDQSITPAIPAADGGAGVAIRTVLAARSAIEDLNIPVEETNARNDFGVANTVQFMQAVFKSNPIYKEMVIANCGAGVLKNHYTSRNVCKMVQLISAVRLLIQGNTGTPQEFCASYQSLSMAELLGDFIPAEWKLPQARCQAKIIEVAKFIINNGAQIPGYEGITTWINQLTGFTLAEAQAASEVNAAMNIDMALVIIEGASTILPGDAKWLTGASLTSTTIVAIAKRGSLTPEHQAKIVDGLKAALNVASINIPYLTCKRYYEKYGQLINGTNAERVFERFRLTVPTELIIIRNVVMQSVGAGLTTFITITRAFRQFPTFPWDRLYPRITGDFTNYRAAQTAIGDNLYYGFSANAGAASAKRFPSLAHTAFELCIKVGGDRPLRDYEGKPRNVPEKQYITRLIQEYIDRQAEDATEIELTAAQRGDLNAIVNHAVNAQNIA